MRLVIIAATLVLLGGCATYVNKGICELNNDKRNRLSKNIYEYLGQANTECRDQIGSNFGRLNKNVCYVMVIPGGSEEQCPIVIHGEYYLLFKERTLEPTKKLNYVRNYKLHF